MPTLYGKDNGLAHGFFRRIFARNAVADTVAINLGQPIAAKAATNLPTNLKQIAYNSVNGNTQGSANLLGGERVASWLFVALAALAMLEVIALVFKR